LFPSEIPGVLFWRGRLKIVLMLDNVGYLGRVIPSTVHSTGAV